jgi:hypothetical protein
VKLFYWHHRFDVIQFPSLFWGEPDGDRLAARMWPALARWKA